MDQIFGKEKCTEEFFDSLDLPLDKNNENHVKIVDSKDMILDFLQKKKDSLDYGKFIKKDGRQRLLFNNKKSILLYKDIEYFVDEVFDWFENYEEGNFDEIIWTIMEYPIKDILKKSIEKDTLSHLLLFRNHETLLIYESQKAYQDARKNHIFHIIWDYLRYM